MQDVNATKVAVVTLIFLVGWLVARLVSRSLERVASRNFDMHRTMLIRRVSFYLILGLTIVTGLNEAGINLSVVVGAAGVASVAIGFASQTSMSNLISGIFIVIEKPFMVGDTIRIGMTSGEVHFMGILSTILKTPDNIMVRIPNENLMKSEIFNTTRFSTRRFDLTLNLVNSVDLTRLKEVLKETASTSPHLLHEPAPAVSFKEFGAQGNVQVVLSAWSKANLMNDASFELSVAVKKALDLAGMQLFTPNPKA